MQKKHSILTSKAIQKRFFTAAEKKKEVFFNPKFMLIDVSGFDNLIKVSDNPQDVDGNATKEEEEVKEEVKEREGIESVINSWNTFAEKKDLPKMIKLTDKRKKHILQRIKEKEFNLDKIFLQIEDSDFLLGLKTDFKADLDFITKNGENYVKILEGKYHNGRNNNGVPKTTPKEVTLFNPYKK
jgi:hypothetical protein